MKVVVDGVVYQEQSKGGISRIYKEILPIMCDMDESLRIKFLVPKKPKQSFPQHPHIKHCHIPELELYLRPNRLWGPLIPRAKWLARRLCTGRGKGQIWHSTHFTMPEIWDGLQIVTVHDMIYEHFADLFNTPWDDQFRKQRRACIQKADALICVSETTRQNLQRLHKIDSNSVYVVHNGYSNIFRQLEQQVSVLESPVKMPFLLYVGDRNHYKNADRLLQAYSVWKHRKKVALVVVGGQWKADEERRLTDLGIQDYVRLFTGINDEELCKLYNQAIAFVYPSLYEGFGIPLLEAMACGCPIVASRIPSTVEVAGDCPIYFEPAEIDDLLNAFDIALSEGRESARVKAGLEKVTSYSWDKTAAQTLEVYQAFES